MNKELLEQIDSMIERLALIELHTGKSEGTPIDKHTLLEIQRELKSQEIKDSDYSEALECSLKLYKMVESAGNGNGFNLNEAWKYHNTIKQALIQSEKDEAKIEKLKQENTILHIELATFEKLMFKK